MIFPRSWYPLCRSSDLKQGTVIPREAFGHKLAVFRTQKGTVGALDAQCCHIGADLSTGRVNNDFLCCPLHRWSFDTQGQCKHIPCQEKIPRRAKQTALRCIEHYGLVYAYLGEKPDFTLPAFPGTDKNIFSSATIIDFDSPYEMAGANSFDEQHLAAVHHRRVVGRQEISSCSEFHFAIVYRAAVTPHTIYDKILHSIGNKQVHMRLDCWGGNLLLFSHMGTPNKMMISLLPISATHSRAFICTVLPRGNSVLYLIYQWLAVRLLHKFTMMFVKQDIKALQGINFGFNVMLPDADATMIKWYQYWKKLPSSSLGTNRKAASTRVRNNKVEELIILD